MLYTVQLQAERISPWRAYGAPCERAAALVIARDLSEHGLVARVVGKSEVITDFVAAQRADRRAAWAATGAEVRRHAASMK